MTPPAASPAAAAVPLKQRFLRAGSWTALSFAVTLVLRLGSSLVITRLLAPEIFGVMAVVTAMAVIATLLSDIGIRQAVVHSPHGDEALMLNTAWSMQIARGIVIWLSCCLCAVGLLVAGRFGWLPEGSVYASAQLPWVLVLASLTAVIQGGETTKRFTADRRIEQGRIALIELGCLMITIAITLIGAYLTRSIYAIVLGNLVGAACSTALGHLLLHGHHNRLAWHREHARAIFDYGKWVLLSSLLFVLAYNGDKLLLALWVTPAVLGCYAIAQNLAQVLESASGKVFTNVASPAFGDVMRNNPSRMREVYLRLRLPFDLMFVGTAGLLFALGPSLVGLLYDPRYAEAGSMLQILSCALVFTRYGISSSAYLALNEPKAQAWMSLSRVIAFYTAVPLAYAQFGVHGAYWAIALHGAASAPVVWWFDRRFGLSSWRHELLTLGVWPVGWLLGWMLSLALGALGVARAS
jgi:O-antigen/teichoic acid export membrane protein